MRDSHVLNEISGCLEAAGPMELTLLAVALVPMDRLEALVDDVVDIAERNVRTKVTGCIRGVGIWGVAFVPKWTTPTVYRWPSASFRPPNICLSTSAPPAYTSPLPSLHSVLQSWASRDDAAKRRTTLSLVRARALMRRHLRLALLRLRLWPEIDRVSRELDRMMRGDEGERSRGTGSGGR